ncbi:hypothetical protein [Ohtaekwangia koreensis]|uniref:Uncharacterized protein n=1 Tax=Ohtaekwangia koreensis TaxID=688867 RepID=A0A1T5LBR2_9BACT|nr:hypothetical protein [Ohtaekwangia koreensis]SKC73432.1 hypothetical protein SAMN05660236_2921 [Ohtaekwangia koreensis]
MEKHAKQRKRSAHKKTSPVNSAERSVPSEKREKPVTDAEVSAGPEQNASSSDRQETVAQTKEWERQPRVNADEQKNIVNNPEHSQDEITDQRDK